MNEITLDGRTVGEVRSDGYFQKHLRFSKHLLRKPRPSIAFDIATLDAAQGAGAHAVEIFDDETGQRYRASIRAIRAGGFRVNRGFGEQIALSLGNFVRPGGAALTEPQAEARQLELAYE